MCRDGNGTISLQDFIESLVMLSNHMSQVQQSFAIIYQQLVEHGCSADSSGNISCTALQEVLTDPDFVAELTLCGLDLAKLQAAHAEAADQDVIARSALARLVADSWVAPPETDSETLMLRPSRDTAFGDLGEVGHTRC